MEYDILGRVKRQSVPIETNSGYTPAGDDTGGPLWTHFKYDWMGRVIRKINTDGVDDPTPNDSDIFISYGTWFRRRSLFREWFTTSFKVTRMTN